MSVFGSRLLFLMAISAAFIEVTAQENGGERSVKVIFTSQIVLSDSSYSIEIPDRQVIPGSVRVYIDSLAPIAEFTSFTVRYTDLKILLDSLAFVRRVGEKFIGKLIIQWVSGSIELPKGYTLRTLQTRQDSVGKTTRMAVRTAQPFKVDDIFNTGLQRSGSIFRGISIGTNRDVSLTSGFRMSLSGNLSEDVEITAILTDENTPLQPEGTTQQLRELDRVFVEIRSKDYSATLGDFNMEIARATGGEFLAWTRKLQGASLAAKDDTLLGLGVGGTTTFIAASSRGKYHSNTFQGVEGNQGPYRLTGASGEQRILVVAGSERVFVNGQRMTRGENNDYVIEYASGEVFFTTNKLISSDLRITVDFEYTDRQYSRTLLGGTISLLSTHDRSRINIVYINESDDKDSPIDLVLNDSLKSLLSRAGTDPFRASIPGWRDVGIDSLSGVGRGQYVLRDTTILSAGRSYFFYAPGNPEARFAVTFSPIDRMPPDSLGYVRTGSGRYVVAGLGRGNYLPLIFLPLPRSHQAFGVNGELAISSSFSLFGDAAASSYLPNSFSDTQSSKATAYSFGVRYNEPLFRIAGWSLGSMNFDLRERYLGGSFISPDRVNDPEFERRWDIERSQRTDERIREGSMRLSPVPSLVLSGGFGTLDRSMEAASSRWTAGFGFHDKSLPSFEYGYEFIESARERTNENTNWIKHFGTAGFSAGPVTGSIEGRQETRSAHRSSLDSLEYGSFSFMEWGPSANTKEVWNMTFGGSIRFRNEDSTLSGDYSRAYSSVTQQYQWRLREWKNISSTFSMNLRSISFTAPFKIRGNTDSDVLLLRSQTRYSPFQRAIETDLFYEFTTQRSARLERVFVRVPQGSGNYRYVGDINGNFIADEEEFELTRFEGDFIAINIAGDELYPVVDLKTSLRLKLKPARVIRGASDWEEVLKVISTETFVRVEEKSSENDTKHIYLLNFSRFLSPATTLSGTQQLTQDLHFWEDSRDLSIRLRGIERKGYQQYITIGERSAFSERSLRIRSQLVTEIGNVTEIYQKLDNVQAAVQTIRTRNLLVNGITSDFSYRPDRNWEIGLVLESSETSDRYPVNEIEAGINSQAWRAIYSIPTRGQVRFQLQRDEVGLAGSDSRTGAFPFELTNGKPEGISYLLTLQGEYRLGNNLQLSLSYLGRSERGGKFIHLGQMEARAFF